MPEHSNPAGYTRLGGRCTCPCHNPGANILHFAPCCSPNPPWVDLPLDHSSLVDALKPFMFIRDGGEGDPKDMELHFNALGVKAFTDTMTRDEFPDIEDRMKSFFDKKLLGFPTAPMNPDVNPDEPLMYVVEPEKERLRISGAFRFTPSEGSKT